MMGKLDAHGLITVFKHYSEHDFDPTGTELDNTIEVLESLLTEGAKWKERCESLANFNPDWDVLEATQESLREHMQLLKTALAESADMRKRLEKIANMRTGMNPDALAMQTVAMGAFIPTSTRREQNAD